MPLLKPQPPTRFSTCLPDLSIVTQDHVVPLALISFKDSIVLITREGLEDQVALGDREDLVALVEWEHLDLTR